MNIVTIALAIINGSLWLLGWQALILVINRYGKLYMTRPKVKVFGKVVTIAYMLIFCCVFKYTFGDPSGLEIIKRLITILICVYIFGLTKYFLCRKEIKRKHIWTLIFEIPLVNYFIFLLSFYLEEALRIALFDIAHLYGL